MTAYLRYLSFAGILPYGEFCPTDIANGVKFSRSSARQPILFKSEVQLEYNLYCIPSREDGALRVSAIALSELSLFLYQQISKKPKKNFLTCCFGGPSQKTSQLEGTKSKYGGKMRISSSTSIPFDTWEEVDLSVSRVIRFDKDLTKKLIENEFKQAKFDPSLGALLILKDSLNGVKETVSIVSDRIILRGNIELLTSENHMQAQQIHLDPSYPLIAVSTGSYKKFERIYEELRGDVVQTFQRGPLLFPVNCHYSSNEVITFNFNMHCTTIQLPLTSLIVNSGENKTCYFGIIAILEEKDVWILGKPFFDSNEVTIGWKVEENEVIYSASFN